MQTKDKPHSFSSAGNGENMVPMSAEPHTLLWDYRLSAQLVRTHSTILKMTPGSVSVPPVRNGVKSLCKECQT